MNNKDINTILQDYSTKIFSLEYVYFNNSIELTPKINAADYEQIVHLMNSSFGYSSYMRDRVFDRMEGPLIIARLKQDYFTHKKGKIIGLCIADKNMGIDPYSSYRYNNIKTIQQSALNETFISYLVVDPQLKNINNLSASRLRGVGSAMYMCMQEMCKSSDIISLKSVNNDDIKDFYQYVLQMDNLGSHEFAYINNSELQSLARLNANILTYCTENKIFSLKELRFKLLQGKIDEKVFTKDCRDLKKITLLQTLGITAERDMFTHNNRLMLQEILSKSKAIISYTLSPHIIDNYREFLLLHKSIDMSNTEICDWSTIDKIPTKGNKHLKQLHNDNLLPMQVSDNMFVYLKNSVANKLSDEQLDKHIKLMAATRIELADIHHTHAKRPIDDCLTRWDY